MRKHLRFLMMAAAILFVNVAKAADDVTVGDFTFNFYTNGNAYVTSYLGSETTVNIPATITYNKEGKDTTVNVTGFGPSAFEDNTTIQKIVLGRNNSYTFGPKAFKGCTALKFFSWAPSSGATGNYITDRFYITTSGVVPESCFEGCSAVTYVYARWSNKLTVGNCAFKGMSSMTNIQLYATTIGSNAFEGCDALTNLLLYVTPTVTPTTFAGIAAGTRIMMYNPEQVTWEFMNQVGDYASQVKAYVLFSTSATRGYKRVVSTQVPYKLTGNGLNVYYVSGVTETSAGITVDLEELTGEDRVLAAGNALIIQYTGTGTSPYWVMSFLTENPEVTYTNYLTGASTAPVTLPASDGTTNYYTFAPVTTKGSEGTWSKVTEETTINIGSGYIEMKNGNAVSGITTISADDALNGNDTWYTIDGKRLQAEPTTKGIYVRGGKKIVVK